MSRLSDLRTRVGDHLPVAARLAFGLLLLLAAAVASIISLHAQREADAFVKRTHEVGKLLAGVLSELQDADIAQRGYIITGDERNLGPYNQALPRIAPDLDRLGRLIVDPAQQQRLQLLRPLVADKLADVDQGIDLRRRRGFESPSTFIASGRGQADMDRIRVAVAEMQAAESRLLAEREARAEQRQWWMLGSIVVAMGVGMTLMTLATAYAWRSRLAARAAYERLRESERRLRAIFDNAASGIVETDGRDRFVAVNDRLCQMLGYAREELLRMSVRDLTYPEDRPRSDELNGQLHDGRFPMFQYEKRYFKRDGSPLWVQVAVSAIRDGAGRYLNSVGTVVDISQRKLAEEERLALQRQMEQTQRLESLGTLAGGIAHDFNNLMMVVLGYADLAMKQAPPRSPACESLVEIETAGRRAAELCRQMLAYSGRGQFVLQALDLSRVIDDMVVLLQATISETAVLALDLQKSIPPLEGDLSQVRQIVMSLVTNGSEAIGDRGGTIRISTGVTECSREMLAETYLDDNLLAGYYVYLEVSDTGCGMSRETLARIFEPFFTTKFLGRGLGMAAVLGIVRGHHGAIHITSELGTGTTIRVYFPVRGEDAPVAAATTTPTVTAAATFAAYTSADSPSGPSGLVLLVDDEEPLRLLETQMFGALGYEVLPAADGQEAVELYAARWHEIDLVVLDLTMPRMDGEQTLRELRRINPVARVIMSSGYDEQDVSARFAGKGLAGFLQKPYRLATLKETLAQLACPAV